jgi:hydroxylamine dehydrogenase
MTQFDNVVKLYNTKFGEPAAAIMAGLYEQGLLTPMPFDEPIEFTYWELWHDEGARARHGASMMSPNHAWWEGMYLVGRNFYSRFLPEARAAAGERAAELVDAHIDGAEGHAWLARSGVANPILGWMPPAPPPAEAPAAEPAVDAVPDGDGAAPAAAPGGDEASAPTAGDASVAAAEEGVQ